MPVYRPPLLGVSQSEALAEAYASATVGDPPAHTIALYHPNFLDESGNEMAIYVVNDFQELQATIEAGAPLDAETEVTFQPVPYEFVLPEQSDSGSPPEVQLSVDNVSAELIPHLDAAAISADPIRLIARTYLRSDTSAPHELPPLDLVIRNVSADLATVTASAGYGDLANRKFPSKDYRRDLYPALSAR